MKAQSARRVPDPLAFKRFLSWLDEGTDSRGERYIEIRRRLISYFDRKGCTASGEMADETLNRVARRLEEEGTIRDATPAQYCYVTAKFVLLEHFRKPEHQQVSLDGLSRADQLASSRSSISFLDAATARKEKLDECLGRCLQKLTPASRDLIESYYQGEREAKIQHRRELAARLGLSMNAITIPACRIRPDLEGCVRKCSEE